MHTRMTLRWNIRHVRFSQPTCDGTRIECQIVFREDGENPMKPPAYQRHIALPEVFRWTGSAVHAISCLLVRLVKYG